MFTNSLVCSSLVDFKTNPLCFQFKINYGQKTYCKIFFMYEKSDSICLYFSIATPYRDDRHNSSVATYTHLFGVPAPCQVDVIFNEVATTNLSKLTLKVRQHVAKPLKRRYLGADPEEIYFLQHGRHVVGVVFIPKNNPRIAV